MPSSKTKTKRLQRRAEKKRAFEARVVQEMIALYYKKYPNPHEEKELLEILEGKRSVSAFFSEQ